MLSTWKRSNPHARLVWSALSQPVRWPLRPACAQSAAAAAHPPPAPSVAPPKYESPRPACSELAHETGTPPAGSAEPQAAEPGTALLQLHRRPDAQPFAFSPQPIPQRQMKAVQLHARMKVVSSPCTMRARSNGSARCARTSTTPVITASAASNPPPTHISHRCLRQNPARLAVNPALHLLPIVAAHSRCSHRFEHSIFFSLQAQCRILLGTDASAD
jgi:hypothetical protein